MTERTRRVLLAADHRRVMLAHRLAGRLGFRGAALAAFSLDCHAYLR